MSKFGAIAAAYALVGIITFGHAFTRYPQDTFGRYDPSFTAMGACLSAMMWPFYWSAQAWSFTK